MKFRNGFVTNSSSSSFVCEVCGRSDGGYDVYLDGVQMVQCENGHIYCLSHLIQKPNLAHKMKYIRETDKKQRTSAFNTKTASEIDKLAKELLSEVFKEDYEDEEIEEMDLYDAEIYEIDEKPAIFCPICMMEDIPDYILKNYLLKKYGITYEEVKEDMNKNFGSLDELMEAIKNA